MSDRVGVVAIQGDFEQHAEAFRRAGVEDVTFVRLPEHLSQVDRLVIPGGESTTVGMLMERFGLAEAVRRRAGEGMPVWGTCMGMILMATEVEGREQPLLGILDVTVRRNAFGAQPFSFEDQVPVEGLDEPVLGVFIRAPIVTRCGPRVEPIGTYNGSVVAVRHGRLLATAFHPELTPDTRLHQMFLDL